MQQRRERQVDPRAPRRLGKPKQGDAAVYFVHALVDRMQKTLVLRYHDLAEAMAEACTLIRSGAVDVQIQDDRGRRVSGSELGACCRGERILRADLKAEPVLE